MVRALLARGDEVRCMVRRTSRTACLHGLPVELVYGDVGDYASLRTLAGRFTGRAPYLTLDKVREMLAGSWICSAEKAVRKLGFSVAAPLPERFQETALWYRRQGWM